MRKPGPILTQDRLEADAGLGEELDPQSARGEADDVDAAVLVQLEQQLAGRTRSATRPRSTRSSPICSRTPRSYEPAVKNPPHGDAKNGEKIVKSIGCQGCHVVGEGSRERGRSAPDVRPAAREHRQQDHLRVDLQLGARSEALQPGTYMPNLRLTDAQVGRRGDLSDRRSRARRRCGEGHARSEGRRRHAARLLQERAAVRGSEGAAREAEPASRSRSSSASASSTGTAASAATTSRASRRRSRSAPTCRKKAASWSRGSTSRSSPTSRTRRRSAGSGRKLHDPRDLRQGPRAAAARQAAHAELRSSATSKSIGC